MVLPQHGASHHLASAPDNMYSHSYPTNTNYSHPENHDMMAHARQQYHHLYAPQSQSSLAPSTHQSDPRTHMYSHQPPPPMHNGLYYPSYSMLPYSQHPQHLQPPSAHAQSQQHMQQTQAPQHQLNHMQQMQGPQHTQQNSGHVSQPLPQMMNFPPSMNSHHSTPAPLSHSSLSQSQLSNAASSTVPSPRMPQPKPEASPMRQGDGNTSQPKQAEQSPLPPQVTAVANGLTSGLEDPANLANNPNAAPGPIPATTPTVVRQDKDGVHWIAFEYSRDRVKTEYTIRCDVESVNTDSLSQSFKENNCVYPRAFCDREKYTGNRLAYETDCNTVGWSLAELNPNLREKRGLIQRAVDSWRNSNSDSRLRSRRVRRMHKMHHRKSAGPQASGVTAVKDQQPLPNIITPSVQQRPASAATIPPMLHPTITQSPAGTGQHTALPLNGADPNANHYMNQPSPPKLQPLSHTGPLRPVNDYPSFSYTLPPQTSSYSIAPPLSNGLPAQMSSHLSSNAMPALGRSSNNLMSPLPSTGSRDLSGL